MSFDEMENIVRNTVSEERYYHSICTAKQCEKLARRYNVDVTKAKLIGIAHDIAREMAEEDKIQYIADNNIIADEIELKRTGLLHAKIGANICKEKFNFTEDMVKAIEAHTTGKPNMDILAKVLFVADSIGEDRKWENVDYLRELAGNDIEAAMMYILEIIIKDMLGKRKLLHTDTILTRNSLILRKYYN